MSGCQVDAGIAREQRGECSMSRPAVCLGGHDLGPGQCLGRQRFCAGRNRRRRPLPAVPCRECRPAARGLPAPRIARPARQRNAGILGGESENGVIDAVARQHGDGAIRPEPARQQGAGDGLHAFQRLAIGKPPPSRTGASAMKGRDGTSLAQRCSQSDVVLTGVPKDSADRMSTVPSPRYSADTCCGAKPSKRRCTGAIACYAASCAPPAELPRRASVEPIFVVLPSLVSEAAAGPRQPCSTRVPSRRPARRRRPSPAQTVHSTARGTSLHLQRMQPQAISW